MRAAVGVHDRDGGAHAPSLGDPALLTSVRRSALIDHRENARA